MEKEDTVVGRGTNTRSILSMAYKRNQRTTKTMDVTMITMTVIGTTWRRRNGSREMAKIMT